MTNDSPTINFENSGKGKEAAGNITIKEVQATCAELGFVKKGMAESKPLQQRADTVDFFKALGCTSLSTFVKRFHKERLPAPVPGQEPLVAEKDMPKEEKVTWDVPHVSKYDELSKDWQDMKWRLLPKPGGAVMKPDDWYCVYGAQQQVEKGDQTVEKPMWAHHGGIAFDDRERWEKCNECKGLNTEQAKLRFCKAYGKAMAKERKELNFRKY